MSIPSASKVPPSRPEPAEGREQPDPGDGGRQHERQLDQRDDEIARPGRPRRDPVRGRGAEEDDQEHRDGVRLGRDDERILARRSCRARETRSPGGTRRKIAAIGSSRKSRATPVARTSVARKSLVYDDALGSGEEAGVLQRRLPLVGEDPLDPCLRRRLVAGLRDDRDLVAYARLRPGRDPDHRHLVAHRARVGDVDEAGVGLAERDLAGDGLDVGLLADHLREHRREAHLLQHGAGVAADRHGRVRDHELDVLASSGRRPT